MEPFGCRRRGRPAPFYINLSTYLTGVWFQHTDRKSNEWKPLDNWTCPPSALPQVVVPFLFRWVGVTITYILDQKWRKGFASLAPSTRVGYLPSLSVLFSAFAHTRLPHHAWPNFLSTVIHLLSNECSRSASLPFARYSLALVFETSSPLDASAAALFLQLHTY